MSWITQTAPWKPLREHDLDVRYAVYERLGLPVEPENEAVVQAAGLWCRQCKTHFPAGSLRIGSAPQPHWYEALCPCQPAAEHYCDGSWEDFQAREGVRQ